MIKNFFNLFVKCTRAYSLPMSVMAWMIPFAYAFKNNGNILHGILALIGIIFVHLGANMFDDFIDYKRHLKVSNPLQKGKCSAIIKGEISLKNFAVLFCLLFALSLIIGFYFIYIYKLPVIIIMLVTAVLSLLYPKSSYFGFGEIIIGLIFGPLVFCGVYYVMTGLLSKELMILSIPFGIFVVTLLYTHSFLDFNYDAEDGKKTICILCKNKLNAWKFLAFMSFAAYMIILIGVISKTLSPVYLVTILSIFPKNQLLTTLYAYITKEPANEEEFLAVFNKAQKLTVIFTVLCTAAIFL